MGSLHAAAPADPTRISNSPLDSVETSEVHRQGLVNMVRRLSKMEPQKMPTDDRGGYQSPSQVQMALRVQTGCCRSQKITTYCTPSILQTQHPSPATRKKEGLRVAQLNIEGCRSKSVSLNKFLEEEKVDIAVLIETKLLERTPTPDANSRTVHRLETEQPQGGVAIMCRPGLVSNRLDPLHLPERGTGSLGCGGRNRTRQTTGVVYLPSPS